LNGTELADLKNYFPELYKLKVGDNPIKSIDVFKPLASFPQLKKLEVHGADFTNKDTYRDELFKMLKNVEVIDKMDRNGEEIDSTVYDEDDEFDGEDLEGDEDFEDEDLEGDDDEDEDFDDDSEEEDPKNKSKKKPKRD
jgi:hypothetical protein